MSSRTFSHPVRLSTEYFEQVKAYATENGMSQNEAVERLLKTAFGRLAALSKYAGQKPSKVPTRAAKKAPNKKASKKAKKAQSKKAKKAPSRKAKKAPKQDFAKTGIVEGAVLP
jgi:hypothetical protein